MSKHQEWKMIHLLYRVAKRRPGGEHSVLSTQELMSAGVHCEPDSMMLLEQQGVVTRSGDDYTLTPGVRQLVHRFVVAKGPETDMDVRIDYPEVFVVMPFGEPWSTEVFDDMFEPAIEAAGFEASRGDSIIRVGELSTNLWRQITQAGVIVADVSVPNPNVYYEIGLADALGKDVFLFKQDDVDLPSDFNGVHYHTYSLGDLPAGRAWLTDRLTAWAEQPSRQPFGVKALEDRR